jgi:hypothetical protein
MYLGIDSWAGRRYYKIEIVGETRTKLRVRLQTDKPVVIGRRWVSPGQVLSVHKDSVFNLKDA